MVFQRLLIALPIAALGQLGRHRVGVLQGDILHGAAGQPQIARRGGHIAAVLSQDSETTLDDFVTQRLAEFAVRVLAHCGP